MLSCKSCYVLYLSLRMCELLVCSVGVSHFYCVVMRRNLKKDGKIRLMRLVTDLDKKKQALAVALSLMGRARDSVLEIAAGDLNKDDGMTTLLIKLDTVFLKEEKVRQDEAYTEFDRIVKDNSILMVDYIVEFEQ